MNVSREDPVPVFLSIGFYRLLLAAYPSEFRQEYGEYMVQVFQDLCLRSYAQGGFSGLLWLWALTLFDFFSTVIEEHLQRGALMSKEKFIRLSHWGFVLRVAAFWLISVFQKRQTSFFLVEGSDGLYEWGQLLSGTSGFLFLGAGMLGLSLRYVPHAGFLGRLVTGLGAFNGLSAAVGYVGLMFFRSLPWSIVFWSLTFFSVMLFCLCMTIFGIVTMHRKLLPRWNAAPLLAGLWYPLAVLISGVYESLTGSPMQDAWLFKAVSLLTALGVVAMAFVLQSDSPEEVLEAY